MHMPLQQRIETWHINSPDCIPRPEEMKLYFRSIKKYRLKMKNLKKVTLNAKMDVV